MGTLAALCWPAILTGLCPKLFWDPDAAKPVPGAVDALHGLSSQISRIALVSGRQVGFLAEFFDPHKVDLYGLYGMQSTDEQYLQTIPDLSVHEQGIAAASEEAAERFPKVWIGTPRTIGDFCSLENCARAR